MSAFASSDVPLGRLIPNPKLKFLDQCREVIRFKRLSPRTEEAYVHWIKKFVVFCRDHPHLTPTLSPPSKGAEREKRWRHPREMGVAEVNGFLGHLAGVGVAASTQNQALNALVFMYRHVLGLDLGDLGAFERAKRPERIPVVRWDSARYRSCAGDNVASGLRLGKIQIASACGGAISIVGSSL